MKKVIAISGLCVALIAAVSIVGQGPQGGGPGGGGMGGQGGHGAPMGPGGQGGPMGMGMGMGGAPAQLKDLSDEELQQLKADLQELNKLCSEVREKAKAFSKKYGLAPMQAMMAIDMEMRGQGGEMAPRGQGGQPGMGAKKGGAAGGNDPHQQGKGGAKEIPPFMKD